ncbi:MAG: DUF882 domain-containing protein [Rhodocyclaceae bacterium]
MKEIATRRAFLARAARMACAAPLLSLAPRALAAGRKARAVSLAHTHTGEALDVVYAIGNRYVPAALGAIDRFLRDHYTGEVGRMDPALFDQLHALRSAFGATGPFEVISGYRSAQTNERLRRRSGGVARHSLHMEGRAIDIRLPGVALSDVRDAALEMRAGGVGYYPDSQFVHIDTGRVRTW